MAAKELMGWIPSMKRWQKRYKGKLYAVSPRQLAVEPRTKAASRDAANQWWEAKQAKIDEAAAPKATEIGTGNPHLRLQYPIPPEILAILQTAPDAITEEQKLAAREWKERVDEQAKPRIRQFVDLYRDVPTDTSIGHHV